MPDFLIIENLELWLSLGVTQEERLREQRILLTVQWPIDSLTAATEDSTESSVDYERLAHALRSLQSRGFRTIERLAEEASSIALQQSNVTSVTVTVRKFPLPHARAVSLTITRP
ncbi:MAG: dihydroneopterin aldolase [Candidatus Peribacteraceae bacterium]|nr:dihydroneopterin aldolase [Candidatus Peribacteraceae bacterium]